MFCNNHDLMFATKDEIYIGRSELLEVLLPGVGRKELNTSSQSCASLREGMNAKEGREQESRIDRRSAVRPRIFCPLLVNIF